MTTASAGPGTGAPPPHRRPTPHRELRRLPDQGYLGGVCAGLADYFRVDAAIVRIAAVILAFSGPGVPAYLLAWIFVPPSAGAGASPEDAEANDRGTQVMGLILIAFALSVLWGGWWHPMRRWIFPVGLIVLGGWLILRRSDRPLAPRNDPTAADPTAPGLQPGTAGAGPEGAPASTPVDDPASTGDGPRTDEPDATWSAGLAAPASTDPTWPAPPAPPSLHDLSGGAGEGPPSPPWAGGHGSGPSPHPSRDEDPEAGRRRRILLPTVLGALLVWSGAAFLLGVALQTALAVALCIVGLGFVLGAFMGGSGALIVPAVLLAGALVVTTALDLPLRGPVGQRTWAPQTPEQVSDAYQLSLGDGVLDLTEIDLEDVEELEAVASVGIGHLEVLVPAEVGLEVRGEASIGDVTILERSDSGWGVSVDRSIEGDGGTVLVLDLEVGIGQIEVVAVPTGGGR